MWPECHALNCDPGLAWTTAATYSVSSPSEARLARLHGRRAARAGNRPAPSGLSHNDILDRDIAAWIHQSAGEEAEGGCDGMRRGYIRTGLAAPRWQGLNG